MKIKHLLEIYNQAPNKEADVFVNGRYDNGEEYISSSIGFNFDDENNLELYEVYDDSMYFKK